MYIICDTSRCLCLSERVALLCAYAALQCILLVFLAVRELQPVMYLSQLLTALLTYYAFHRRLERSCVDCVGFSDEDLIRDRDEHDEDRTDRSDTDDEEDDKVSIDDNSPPVETPYERNYAEELGQVNSGVERGLDQCNSVI
jgi:hypothetical protein